jgi:hypothetical protein
MNNTIPPIPTKIKFLTFKKRQTQTLASVALLALAQSASAAFVTLTDGNSTADFDTANQTNNYNWTVDGVDQIFQQAFWFRVGDSGPEQSLHSLPISIEGPTDTNFDGDDDTLFVRYAGSGFDVEVRYTLDGGSNGSGASDMAEQITFNSTSESALDIHFFQYTDFDLNGTAGNDSGVFTNANTVRQFEPGFEFTETVITPVPNHREISTHPLTLTSLNDLLPTTLSDTPSDGTVIGPADLTWAYQWDFTLQPEGQLDGSFQISKDKNLQAVPEPSSTALLGLAGLALILRRRK